MKSFVGVDAHEAVTAAWKKSRIMHEAVSYDARGDEVQAGKKLSYTQSEAAHHAADAHFYAAVVEHHGPDVRINEGSSGFSLSKMTETP